MSDKTYHSIFRVQMVTELTEDYDINWCKCGNCDFNFTNRDYNKVCIMCSDIVRALNNKGTKGKALIYCKLIPLMPDLDKDKKDIQGW